MTLSQFIANAAVAEEILAYAARLDQQTWARVRDAYCARRKAVANATEVVSEIIDELYPRGPEHAADMAMRKEVMRRLYAIADEATAGLNADTPLAGMGRSTFRSVGRLALRTLVLTVLGRPAIGDNPPGRRAVRTIEGLFEGALPETLLLQEGGATSREEAVLPDPESGSHDPHTEALHMPPRRLISAEQRNANEAMLRSLIATIGRKWKDRASWNRLTNEEKVIDGLGRIMDLEIQNGGIDQFLINDAGAIAPSAVTWLGLIGALESPAVLASAVAIFPHGEVPAEADARRGFIAQHLSTTWDDDLTKAYHVHRDVMIDAIVRYAAKLSGHA